MKKGFVISLLAVLALAGCQTKELDYAPQQESKHFTATIEDSFDGGDTRTYMDENGNVRWKQGDQVSIFAGDTVNEQYQVTDASDGKTAAGFNPVSGGGFVGGTDIDNNVAFYPYASTAEIAKSGSAYVISDITLPATQNYAEASFGNGAFPMAAVTSDTDDMHLKFKNVLGGLKLQLKGTASIASISITGNRDEVLCGAAAVTVSNGNAPSINLADETAKSVTLDCGEGVQLNSETAMVFVIALPPMTMEGGFTVVVTDTEGKQMEIKTTKSQTINRSSLLKMPAVVYEGVFVAGGFEYVDLGLSVKWGSYNLGATQPTESGDYYQWAGIQAVTSGSISVNEDNCPYHSGYTTTTKWTKYIPTEMASYWSGTGDPDNVLVLDDGDEVVHRTMGGKWRMPTAEDFQELKENCTMTWTNDYKSTGVKGLILTSTKPGYTDQSIFLPAAGYRYSTSISKKNTQGYYWSSSLYTTSPENARTFSFRSDWKNVSIGGRHYGYTIRPVYDDNYHEHSIVLTPGQSPTETNPGWAECYMCSTCGKYFEDEYGYVPIGDETAYLAWKSFGGNGYLELPQAVDLGLSVKWASCNVGAQNAYTIGNYFAWGETEEKDRYNSSTYLFGYQLSKYCIDIAYGDVDNKIVLEKEDDAAYVNWGGNWRMPTAEEIAELRDNCSWTKYEAGNTEFNGVPGYKAQSLKPGFTDRYIFLPRTGYRYEDRIEGMTSSWASYSSYWSSSLYSGSRFWAQGLGVSGTLNQALTRYQGYPVRPVYSDDPNCGITGVSLDKTVLSIYVDDIETLTGTVIKNAGALNDMIEWSSSNPSVATVDYTGKVRGVAIGTTTITAKTVFGGFTATCNIVVNALPEHEYVDLGLSVKWATSNLGANRPYDYGKYYAWGEIKAFGEEDPSNPNVVGVKRDYSVRTNKYYLNDSWSYSKYETVSSYDSPVILESEDDAAYVNWGSDWRMPTYAEMKELNDNCTFTWFDRGNTEFNGVRGYKVQSNIEGYTDKFIFLPFPGYRSGDRLYDLNVYGVYWTSTLAYDYATRALWFSFNGPNTVNFQTESARWYGASIRPVRE